MRKAEIPQPSKRARGEGLAWSMGIVKSAGAKRDSGKDMGVSGSSGPGWTEPAPIGLGRNLEAKRRPPSSPLPFNIRTLSLIASPNGELP